MNRRARCPGATSHWLQRPRYVILAIPLLTIKLPPFRRCGFWQPGHPLRNSLRADVATTVLVAVAYFVTAELGFHLSLTTQNVSSLWPAAGVALALLWRFGPRYWPGVYAGALLAGLITPVPVWAAALTAAGSTAGALLGVFLLRRTPEFDADLQRLQDVLGLALVSALAPIASATAGVFALFAAGIVAPGALESSWLTWWSGEFLGTLLAAPLLLVWLTGPYTRPRWPVAGEAALLGVLLAATTWGVYFEGIPRPILLYPLVMWAALRFALRGATLAATIVAVGSVWATLAGRGPLVGVEPALTQNSLHIVLGVTAIMGLVIGSVTAERGRALGAWRATSEDLRAMFDTAPVAIVATDAECRITRWNACAERMFGWSAAEVLGGPLPYVPADRGTEYVELAERQRRGETIVGFETVRRHRDGRRLDVSLSLAAIRDGQGRLVGSMAVLEGIGSRRAEQERLEKSERALRLSEAQLRQSQKMEAIGRLAGGVAHDFNNLLTSILGHTELMLGELPADHALRGDLGEVQHAAERAADLTSQLLAFSRKQVIEPRVLDLNGTIGRITGMLRRLIGEHIELTTTLEPTLGRVLADPGQIEQVILNLAVNARDAMQDGGRLRIETVNVVLDEAFTREHVGAVAGPHVMLAVIDQGIGIDPEIQPHIFEPFFTTKDKARGTGLGLATVYGIVKQSGGYIAVESAAGLGTTMRVYLPLAAIPPAPAAAPGAEERCTTGSETILLVEDEASVRGLTRRVLARAGYFVLVARDADDALMTSASFEGPIDLLLTDVIMPGVSGPRLAETLLGLRPETEVLFMSGYNEDTIIRQGVLRQGVAYLQKPFTPQILTQRVRAVLDAGLAGCNGQAPAATASATPELPLATASSSASASAATAPMTVTTGF